MDTKPIKVLLVEDNAEDAQLMREMLGEATGISFELQHTDRLSTALEHLARRGIDVVLLNLELPDSQGLDTLAHVIKHAPEIPVVVLTDPKDKMLGIKAMRKGAQEYLVKGQVDGDVLLGLLRFARDFGG